MSDGVDERKRRTLRRFAALGAAGSFVGGARAATDAEGETDADAGTPSPDGDRSETNETREAIRGYVATTPGAHFSKLRDDLRLGTGETQYHLRKLVDAATIETAKDGEFRRYFPAGRFDAADKRALGALRRETPRGVVLHLLREPDATGSRIADALDVSRPTISAAAGELEDAGLLDRTDGYTLRTPERLITLVVRYADSFGPDARAFADDAAAYVRYDPE
ncbi:Predicted transcriptional regulator, containsd two HTH domains [Halopenitus malekzadehii]|uniref:Predicted transcriptional regulator, containsd two HTH domains n=1 Tax=Halopenitus malekzadehii TaxID=1267564 RepID=A0A1H6HTW8_9EURY|nr:MarR family transcriptional regulator [Halopenitus malekzadehii]SEH38515.1 Predicted transcriptional regulator, containsd two HTH domains [Halopenitus malekzadehii]